jgi:UDP-glucose 4-epimerase
VLKSAGVADFSPEQLDFLTFGRGIDTSRMRATLGFEPSFTTEQAFADFASGVGRGPGTVERVVDGLASSLTNVSDAAATGAVRG